jgi:hypothetical protein
LWVETRPLVASLQKPSLGKHRSRVLNLVLVPSLFYFAAFAVLTWPALQLFSSHILGDQGDALQNYWNIWWVDKAITQLHSSPWHTSYLHYPYGTTLLGQTLNPFNGFMGVVLLRFLSLTQTYNVVVTFSYVIAGLTTFWLVYHLTGSYLASIAGGYVYSFSNYHVVHTQGHLQLVSLEWIPLFILFFWMLITRPSVGAAVGAAVSLLLVLLCDYYYCFYCVMAGALLLGWRILESKRLSRTAIRNGLLPAAVFIVLAAVLTGPLVVALLVSNHNDPFLGSHDPNSYSLDLLAPFTPDHWWRFVSWMPSTWVDQANIEQVTYIGLAMTATLVYAMVKRRNIPQAHVGAWVVVALIFFLLSLGPALHVAGQTKALPTPLPYTLLGDIFPPLSMGGVPSRMIVMTTLSLAVIFGAGLSVLLRSRRGRWIAAPILLALVCIEYLPGNLPESRMTTPGYIQALLSLHDHAPIVNMVDGPGMSSLGLYYQTLIDRPMAFGYISRTPTSVDRKDSLLDARIVETRTDILYRKYGFRYLVVPVTASFPFERTVYQDANARIYQLGFESRRVHVESISHFVWGADFMHDVLPSSVIGQTFTASRDGLRGVGFVLSKNSQSPTGPLVFHLRDASRLRAGPDLVTKSVPAPDLADGYLRVFTFAPFPHSRGHRYYAYLDAPHGTPLESMWVWQTGASTYRGGALLINHKPLSGSLVMQVFYTKT